MHEADAWKLCPPMVAGQRVDRTGLGGMASGRFVLLTTTDLTIPTAFWAPSWSNQFDAFGAFDDASEVSLVEAQRYFRVRVQ